MLSNLVKFFEPLLYPLGVLWLIILAGSLRFFWKRKWEPALYCGMLAALVWLVGSQSISDRLLASLERPYARDVRAPLPQGDAAVMLGGTLIASQHDLFGIDLTAASDRALAALQLMREKKARVLLLGGGGDEKNGKEISEGRLLQKWLVAFGIPAASVVSLETSVNTRDEGLRVQRLVQERGWKRVILITSACHMKRAAATFQQLSVPVVPLACDFVGLNNLEGVQPFQPFPTMEGLVHLTLYTHEVLGWYFYRWKGWIGRGAADRSVDRPK